MKQIIIILIIGVLIIGCGKKETLNGSVELDLTIQERDGAIGKSDKDFTEVTKLKPSTVRNDVTEKWRKITLSNGIDIAEHALSYNKLYMNDDTTIHWIINFGNNTTTSINDQGTYLDVSIREYVSKEEHDAKELGGGMFLKKYQVYKDNGDIVEVGD